MDEKRPRKILLIDDNEDFLETLAYELRKNGHLVMTALDCEAGLQVVRTAPVEVVFLDMQMPGVDGVETLRRIRKMKKDLPVIIVTGHPQSELVERAKPLGISGVFSKEGGYQNLMALMEEVLQGQAQTD
ncbi:MAG: response regulator [Candidatus Omnitrophica bacterium]|nr:response regulator [Candidatus Omnitrophota bacterium]